MRKLRCFILKIIGIGVLLSIAYSFFLFGCFALAYVLHNWGLL